MGPENLPVEYRMEIYIDSYVSHPEASFHGLSPFMAVSVGDEMEPCSWPARTYGRSKIARVISVRHIVFEIEESHVCHSIGVCVNIVDKPEWRGN